MTNKGAVQNFFENFRIGQKILCPTPRLLTEADRVAYISFTGDRTPLFCDSYGLIHPLIVFHTVLGQTVRPISLNAIANLGYTEMTWREPVKVGDEIRTTVEVIGLKENRNQKTGIVYVRTIGTNQRSQVVLQYCRWVMVRKNREEPTPFLDDPAIPSMAPLVNPHQLTGVPPNHFSPETTGGCFFLDDYSIGEKIYHLDGMTVNSSDHMSFTRLYQNSARVHYDTLAAGGSPLVYGGLSISFGYAQAFNGLENRLGIRAINSGTHANPVHAGDTLYSSSEVLDKVTLSDTHGALRLRLLVAKNEPHLESVPIKVTDSSSGRERHNTNIVLDLDYWELMARRSANVGRE